MKTVKLNLKEQAVKDKVINDDFGLFAANEWKKLIDPYTPHRDGLLKKVVQIRPFEIEYDAVYARYIYNGLLMVDPITKKGAFYDPKYGFWSRAGVQKELTDIPLNFRTDMSPFATSHWDQAAAEAGQKTKLYQSLNAYLRQRKE